MSSGSSELVCNGAPSISSHGQHTDLSIRAIDSHSVHRITSGQVVIDLQTAVKELVENSFDAGATNIEVRFQNYGLKAIEVIDNGSGIASKDYDSIALKHYTSKLASFEDLSRVLTFGFRGEALSSLCALSDGITVTTATADDAPMGTLLEMDRNGRVTSRHTKVARQRGTTVTVTNLFKPLPVRRKEFERNAKREFQKALNLLYAYALVPCANENRGVRFTVTNQTETGRKVVQLKSDGTPSTRASVTALWGPKALETLVDLNLSFDVETEKAVLRRQGPLDPEITTVTPVKVHGLISKFAVGAGRSSSDRQYFFVNGRPCNPGKVQKAINEVYRTFNANQSPFVIADFILPTHACDINVSPDKRTIFLHSENSLVQALKVNLFVLFHLPVSVRRSAFSNLVCISSRGQI
ncbi:DNA mismatch repair protein MutL [Phlebopus sp. FC_14]|nr:DNA mismatch repair protein MutL [Phlebopus sp. FC_14]